MFMLAQKKTHYGSLEREVLLTLPREVTKTEGKR